MAHDMHGFSDVSATVIICLISVLPCLCISENSSNSICGPTLWLPLQLLLLQKFVLALRVQIYCPVLIFSFSSGLLAFSSSVHTCRKGNRVFSQHRAAVRGLGLFCAAYSRTAVFASVGSWASGAQVLACVL